MHLRFFRFLFALSTVFCFTAIGFYFCNFGNETAFKNLVASYNYQGPTHPVPGNPPLVRVEVLMRDSPEAGGVRIQSVTFNRQGIPMQKPDIYGNRGSGSFQVPPGKYKLRWVVQRDKVVWPRLLNHEEEVTIDPRDFWLQIEIVGENVSIR